MSNNSKLLEDKGIRPSYQRLRVLGYMQQAKGHPTVEDIYIQLSADIPTLSRTTVYNTLHTLVSAGLVRVLNIDHEETRYEINLHDHGHFRCKKCGSITHFKLYIDLIPTEGLDHYQIQEKNVYYLGLCPECIRRR